MKEETSLFQRPSPVYYTQSTTDGGNRIYDEAVVDSGMVMLWDGIANSVALYD